mgnify:CR=1 FL=1
MGKRSVIPYGPQHPVLPEPIHLDLVIEDEKIIEAIPSIGFIHRGLESLVEKKDFNEMTYVVERTCGICSFMHGMGYCESVEHIMHVEVPDRGKFLRTIWCEMSRMHSHLLWLGLLADAFGFESLFYQCWRMREKILDLFELEQDMKAIIKTFLSDYTVESRLKGVGVLTKQQAHDLGAAGPFARASGIAMDMRKRGYAAYPHIDFEPITSDIGDSYARCDVRIHEVLQSIDIIRQAAAKMPKGEIGVNVKGNPNGEYFMRVEQPRGEAIYYVKANGTKFLDRMRVRTPTFANLPGMLETLKGADLADVALLVLTIDPCISCTER